MLLVRDALRHPSGARTDAPYTTLIYCRVPKDWVTGEAASDSKELWLKGVQLVPEQLEKVFEALYGPLWRNGNSDGSRYEVLAHGTRLLNPACVGERPWELDNPSNPAMRYHYYAADTNGTLHRVRASDL